MFRKEKEVKVKPKTTTVYTVLGWSVDISIGQERGDSFLEVVKLLFGG